MPETSENAVVVASIGSRRLIQIGQIQIEVDLETARPANTFRIGDPVRVLEKDYSSIKEFTGFILEFVDFQGTPSVQVAIVRKSYDDSIKIDVKTWNAGISNLQIMPLMQQTFDRDEVLAILDAQISIQRSELEEQMRRRNALGFAFRRPDERVQPMLVDGKAKAEVADERS